MPFFETDPKRIIVALDFPTADRAWVLVEKLDPRGCRVKVGKELFTREGPAFVKRLVNAGYEVFLDLKFHDIPNTVAAACAAAADLGVWMLNVHAQGGRRMMEAAREAVAAAGEHRPLLIAVTILTSLTEREIHETGLGGNLAANVLRLAQLTESSGLDGVVCSPQEAALLRQAIGAEFCLVTPGVRPAGSDKGDQNRVLTPSEALKSGASYLVIGRPITQAPDPLAALRSIQLGIANALTK
ncbi:MAG: orotidine-5'-phosphate decarboxylase [Gammaproteobacteria bacterium]|nr:orotidine-5'-phosphate decarboxylase [Gammaproteobacteria bacterium]